MAQDNSQETGSAYANTAQVKGGDRALMESPGGRAAPDDPEPSAFQEEIMDKTDTSRPVSDVTNVRPDSGETDDGLDDYEETLRHAAEDIVDTDVGNGDTGDEDALNEAAADADADADADAEIEEDDDRPIFDRGDRI
jgi:hypothetical protein